MSKRPCCRKSGQGSSRRRAAPRPLTRAFPGYYYDPDKNRYFKIDKSQPAPAPTPHTPSLSEPATPVTAQCPGSLPRLLLSRQLGRVPCHLFERRTFQISVFGSQKPVVTAPCHRGTITHLQINEEQDVLLASAKSGHGAALWSYKVSRCNKFFVHIKREDDILFSPVSEITDINFLPRDTGPAPAGGRARSSSVALVTLLGGPGQQGRVSLLDLEEGNLSTYWVPRASVWSGCWNRSDNQSICVGASKGAYIHDIITNTRTHLSTDKSDVLCVRSAARSPLVYTGSLNKMLSCHDLRRPQEPVFQIEHQSSVGDLQLLGGEDRVVCSAFNGQVVQWDVRSQRHVTAYPGHVNDYARVKMKIDESESLLFIPGKDLQTRVWGLDSGALLNTLPPPAEDSIISHQNIPACEVALNWGGFYPGFAIAATGLLHWYSL